MTNILLKSSSKQVKKRKKGKNLVLLPRIFTQIFSKPRYSEACLDVLVLLAKNGFNAEKAPLPKSKHPSYLKRVVIPFLAKLQINHILPDIPVFDSIRYNMGQATISYKFSAFIRNAFAQIHTKTLKNGKTRKGKGYIIVNTDEFFKLRGLYTKQLYLMLCAWQQGQQLDLYKQGEQSIFKLWQIPTSYTKSLVSKLLKPAIAKINTHTRLDIVKIQCYPGKITLIYKRHKTRPLQAAQVIIDRYPYKPMAVEDYRTTLFHERKFAQPPKTTTPTCWKPGLSPSVPNIAPENYVAQLVASGINKAAAKRYTEKKYNICLLDENYFANKGDWKPPC